jgi:hypothetical protein
MKNNQFQGLNFADSKEISSYLHVRVPENALGKQMLLSRDFSFSSNFLDPVSKDKPKGEMHEYK